MSFRAASPVVLALRDMLAACPSWVAAGGAPGQIHHPAMDPAADDTFPRLLLGDAAAPVRVGTGMVLHQGQVGLQLDTYGRLRSAVTAVSVGAQTVQVSGDITDDLAVGDEFFIAGSTGNDGWCRVSAISFGAGVTTVTLSAVRAISDATADGAIFYGSVETLADAIAQELLVQPTGLAMTGGGRQGRAEFPDERRQFGSEIEDLHIRVTIQLSHGLSL